MTKFLNHNIQVQFSQSRVMLFQIVILKQPIHMRKLRMILKRKKITSHVVLIMWIIYNLTCYLQFINCLNQGNIQPAETGVNIRRPEERIHL